MKEVSGFVRQNLRNQKEKGKMALYDSLKTRSSANESKPATF